MNTYKFKLNISNNNPYKVTLNAEEKETHALIRITKGAFCQGLNLILKDDEKEIPKSLPAESLVLLNVSNYTGLTLNSNFSSQKGFIDVEIRAGNWNEMLLAEIELSFSDAPYWYGCNQEKTEFTIGFDGESKLEVKPVDGGFSVTSILIAPEKENLNATYFIAQDTEAEQIIKRLYGRIKGRAKGEGFDERQEQFKPKLIENFNRTMSESFFNTL